MSTDEVRSNDARLVTLDMKLEVRRPPTASTRSAPAARRERPYWYAAYMVAEQAGTELPT